MERGFEEILNCGICCIFVLGCFRCGVGVKGVIVIEVGKIVVIS